MTARAAPAQSLSAHRRSMLAKVHMAPKQLCLTDDDYRGVLFRVTGKLSARDCTDAELHDVLKDFERRGFSAKARPKGPRPADHPSALKARALWISLHHLGAIADPSERALEAFAKRQLKCDRLQWANQAVAYRLIEALKAIAIRHGWDQSVEGLAPAVVPVVLRRRLVERQLGRLRELELAPVEWGIARAAFEFGGLDFPGIFRATTEEFDRVAAAFGAVLRPELARRQGRGL